MRECAWIWHSPQKIIKNRIVKQIDTVVFIGTLILFAGYSVIGQHFIPDQIAHAAVANATQKTGTEKLLQKEDFQYLGAFRLPGGGTRPKTFEYGGGALTFNPQGDASGAKDGFPGSLSITGHDRLAYGELPDGNQVAEIDIPKPVKSKNMSDLPVAKFLQRFQDVAKSFFKDTNPLSFLYIFDFVSWRLGGEKILNLLSAI